jgi:hypothetical protein
MYRLMTPQRDEVEPRESCMTNQPTPEQVRAAVVDALPGDDSPVKTRGTAVLYLYRETVVLLQPVMHADHLEVVEQAVQEVNEALTLITSTF